MEFNTDNIVIKLCLQGMEMEEKGQAEEAAKQFMMTWNEATNEFEKFTAAYYVARHQANAAGRLQWYEAALQYALSLNNDAVKAAYTSIYSNIAKCYEELGEHDSAKKHEALAVSLTDNPADKGPFYHGTRADMQVGDLLTAGRLSNYKAELQMNHIYFTALASGAGLAAALAKGEGRERVYIVEPTGSFENDPNVTNKKFPGNPTRSYRTQQPLKVIGEQTDWMKQTPEEIQKWRERLKDNEGEIIN